MEENNIIGKLRMLAKNVSSDYFERIFILLDEINTLISSNISLNDQEKKNLAKVYYTAVEIVNELEKRQGIKGKPNRFKSAIFPEFSFEYEKHWNTEKDKIFKNESSVSYKKIDDFLQGSGFNAIKFSREKIKGDEIKGSTISYTHPNLVIGNNMVLISGKTAGDILNTIFQHNQHALDIWYLEAMCDEHVELGNYNKKNLYDALSRLNKKIEDEIYIKDFLVLNKTVVQINPKYNFKI